MITYKPDNLSTLDNKTIQQLKKLSMDNGVMRNILKKRQSKHIVIAYDKDIPIGWCMFMESKMVDKNKKTAYISVFVNPNYRRQGIGKELIKNITNILKSQYDFLTFVVHDKNSYFFFKDLGTQKWKTAPADKYDDSTDRKIEEYYL